MVVTIIDTRGGVKAAQWSAGTKARARTTSGVGDPPLPNDALIAAESTNHPGVRMTIEGTALTKKGSVLRKRSRKRSLSRKTKMAKSSKSKSKVSSSLERSSTTLSKRIHHTGYSNNRLSLKTRMTYHTRVVIRTRK